MVIINKLTICLLAASPLHALANVSGNTDSRSINLLDSSKVYDIDEVVVVSQPKDYSKLRMRPSSSYSFSGNDINQLMADDLRGISAFVPSFSMPEYGSRLTSSMYIRGIGSRVNSPAVGIYIDDMPLMSKSAYNFHTYQISRLDVMQGPQGTLYGQNAEGGIVRMYTKDPLSYQGTDFKVGAGAYALRNVEFGHYAKASDLFAYSLSGFYNGWNGFLKNMHTGGRADDLNEAGGRLKLSFNPNKKLRLSFISDYQYVNQNGFAYGKLDVASGHAESPSSNYQGHYKRNMLNTGFTARYLAGDLEMNSTTTYQFLSDNMLMDQDYLPVDFMHLSQKQLQNSISEELTVKNTRRKTWNFTFGAFGNYQWLKTEAPVYFGDAMTAPIASGIQKVMYNAILSAMVKKMVASGMPEAVAESMAKQTIEKAGGVSMKVGIQVPGLFHTPTFNIGLFHESNIEISDRLSLTAGLRYDMSRVSVEYNTQAYMPMTANVMGKEATYTLLSSLNNKAHDIFNQLLPKIGVRYVIDENKSNIYASASKGYRAGGYNIQMFSDILQTELMANGKNAMSGDYVVEHSAEDYERINKTIAYKPETSWNYEVGTHLNLFDGMLHVDLSGYWMEISNQQLSVMAGNYGFGRMMVNAGKSRSIGVEAAARGMAFNNHLSWALSYGLVNSTFRNYTDSIQVDGVKKEVSYKGKKVPYIPMHTVGANVDYRIDFSSSFLHSLTVGVNMSAQGRTYWDEANSYSQPFYAVLGARVTAAMKKASVSVWCKNMTDTNFNTFAISSSATGEKLCFAQRGTPFQIGAELSIHL